MRRSIVRALGGLLLLVASASPVAAQQPDFFVIEVVEKGTGAPIGCVDVETVHSVRHTTDRSGIVAFYEPGLMGVETFFSVKRAGYRFPVDGFGLEGVKLTPVSGGRARVEGERIGTPPPCSAGDVESRLAARPVPAPSERFKIVVVDMRTSRPVPLAEVSWPGGAGITDSNGLLAFFHPDLMGQRVRFVVKAHGYDMYDPQSLGFLEVTAKGGDEVVLRVVPKEGQVARRLYRVTGGGIYRESALLGAAAPTKHPLLNGQVLGQDSVLSTLYKGQPFYIWGDTNRPSYPLGNFRATGGRSALPDQGGLDPAVGLDIDYFLRPGGFAKEMAPVSAIPNPQGVSDFLAAWLTGLSVVPDASGDDAMFMTYALVKSLSDIREWGVCRYDDAKDEFVKVRAYGGQDLARPDGTSYPWRHPSGDLVYFHNLVRAPASAAALADPATYEGYTPVDASGAIERDATGHAVYRWRAREAAVDQAAIDTGLPLAKPERLFGHLRDPWSGRGLIAHGNGCTTWNPYRGRFLRMVLEVGGQASFLGEIHVAEADTPMGPWVYARQVVTHDRMTFYNPRQHPFLDKDGGRVIYFEGTYTRSFTNEAPTPRYEYNQVMYELDLADPRAASPVAVYDIAPPSLPGHLVTKRGLRPGMADRPAAFFAYDRALPGLVPVAPRTARCASEALVADGSSTLPPLFYALPASTSPAPPDAVPLYHYADAAADRHAYSTDGALSLPGLTRDAEPFVLVWQNPIDVTLPVSEFLGDLVADAGPDRCVSPGAPVTLDASASASRDPIASVLWSWPGGSATTTVATVTLPAGVHAIELRLRDAAGRTSTDHLVIAVGAPPRRSSSGGGCAASGAPASGTIWLVALALAAIGARALFGDRDSL